MKNHTAFVSYSWDSMEHKEWVIGFTNKLRKNGIDATNDVFETQKGTTNLYSMMANNIRIKDFIIVIITDNYCKRADKLEGGVGFETELLLPLIQSNKDKIILIVRNKSQGKDNIPFYLNGIHYFDFSDDTKFDEMFKGLLYRILGVERYLVAPLGDIPNLKSKDVEEINKIESHEFGEIIPNLKRITDLEKNRFMKESFIEMKKGFTKLLENTKSKNPNFEYEYDDITSKKTIFKIYLDGNLKYSIKIWLYSTLGDIENINLAYGNRISSGDNSANEIINCEVDEDNNLKLRMIMNMFSSQKFFTAIEIAIEIWKRSLSWIK